MEHKIYEKQEAGSLSRKDREKLQRKKEMMHAARRVFADKGYAEATLDDIAAKAEFGKGTLYNYFSSKEDIFVAAFEECLMELAEELSIAIPKVDTTKEKVRTVIETSLFYYNQRRSFLKILVVEQAKINGQVKSEVMKRMHKMHLSKKNLITNLLADGIKSGEIKGLNPEKLAAALDNLIRTYIHYDLLMDEDFDQTENAKEIFTIFWSGAGSTNGGEK